QINGHGVVTLSVGGGSLVLNNGASRAVISSGFASANTQQTNYRPGTLTVNVPINVTNGLDLNTLTDVHPQNPQQTFLSNLALQGAISGVGGVNFTGGGAITVSAAITASGPITMTGDGQRTISGDIPNASSISLNGASAWALN